MGRNRKAMFPKVFLGWQGRHDMCRVEQNTVFVGFLGQFRTVPDQNTVLDKPIQQPRSKAPPILKRHSAILTGRALGQARF